MNEVKEHATFLIADDDSVIRRILLLLLTSWGYKVVEARDGLEALVAAERHPIACVLLNVWMPNLNGFEVCRRLKTNPDTKHVPVVLITGLADSESLQQGMEAGADEIIVKPVRQSQLLAVIQRII